MADVKFPWKDGTTDELTVTYDADGEGTLQIDYISDVNEGVDRSAVLVVETVNEPVASEQLIINQSGRREELYSLDSKLIIPSDAVSFNVLKSSDSVSSYNEAVIKARLEAAKSPFFTCGMVNYIKDTQSLNGLTATGSTYGFATKTLERGLIAGKQYTFSFRGRIDSQALADGKTLQGYIYQDGWPSGGININMGISTTYFSTIYRTFIATSTIAASELRFGIYNYPSSINSTGIVTLLWAKLEEGDYNSDWSPNPQDAYDLMNDINNLLDGN